MQIKKAMSTSINSNTIASLVFLSAGLLSANANAEEFFTIKDGELQRPTGYREWVYVGTPVTPNDMNNGKAAFPEHHNVYIDPKSWAHWKETGEFRDGTIIMKELVSVGSKAAVSGNGYFQGEFIGLEATIKSKKHNPNEPGNWSYYSFSTPDHDALTEVAKPFPAASCNACHQSAAADDFVFTQYYPVLRAGKGTGEEAAGGFTSTLK
ncbi:cytochrome P460 family protein [Enterovibrio sp. ZSDZ35]|uniref:Cytochrome P460 family protein n=1 Tax=Enterovibrio qingdaonensis TaxID=2899818 RepID=A0ABT5QSA6_9GAMM|nr:cytochrome P460 family protein [Enterovibrio sp. ZSDZ35]MDD1783360.1 cytochrome P460 family protein [Enterovibrio sp. ZSDZ35]